METLVKVRDLHKVYYRGSEQIDVLQGITLDIPSGDFLALMGPSGSGKTTLLNLIGGLDTPSKGSIDVAGDRIDQLSGGKLVGLAGAAHRVRLPDVQPAAGPDRGAERRAAAAPHQTRRPPIARSGCMTALNVVGLGERANHYPRQLSGGQEQRVGIARAIVTDPTLLLCDEPTGDLDRKSGDEVLNLLQTLNREHGKTIVMVTHDPRAADCAQADAAPGEGPARRGGGERMKFLPLVWRNLMRRKIRTFMTLMSIVVAFVLFAALMAIRAAFSLGVDVAGADRLMMIHKVSIIQSLPRSYEERIRATEGVTQVTHANWFGGYYQEPTNFVQSMAVDPESWLQMYPEFELPADQKKAWIADRTGAVIGADLAKRYGWKVGDRVPLLAPIYQRAHEGAWEFTIDGIYDSAKQGVDKTQFFFHFEYLNEVMRKIPGAGRSDRVVHLPGRRSIDVRSARQKESTRCSPTRRPKPRPRRKRRSSPIGPNRSATSAAS